MKTDIRDVEAVRAILPVDAALYLRDKGWRQTDADPGRTSMWDITARDEAFEALLPMDSGLQDYALRMGDLLNVLAVVESRSQGQVYSDLLTVSSDVLRIRIADPELTDGTLPIDEHVQIAQKARDLVLAAACAATERRAVWHTRKPAAAMDQVRRVRIGQTERGSYIITVISRITPQLEHAPLPLIEDIDPFERQVTTTLAHSLQALGQAAEQAALDQQMAAFDRAIPEGVNSNLCDAVVGLWGGDDIQRSLEFSFSWSPTRRVAEDTVQKVMFSADRIPMIREAGRQMREREPLPDFELHGPVIKLERADGAATGKMTVMGLVEDRQARVVLELKEAQYNLATQAHGQGTTVSTGGTLVREGGGYVLKNPSALVVELE